jgi:cytochrome b pre-mRNA-processing protein 3
VEGRLELLTLHVILLLQRLRDRPDVCQELFDTYVSNLDGALREMGVGDLAMAKRMKGLGAMFYGRAKAYDAAFTALPGEAALRDIIGRTILHGQVDRDPAPLAAYILRCRSSLAEQTTSALLAEPITWAAP